MFDGHMNPVPLPVIFECLRFLWQGVDAANRRLEFIDECWEDRWWWVGETEDSTELSDDQEKEFAADRGKTQELVVNLGMTRAIVGQSLIIAIDKIVKSVTTTIANSNVGPTVPPHAYLPPTNGTNPQYWANAVRVAANYVRHGGEWKLEQMAFTAQQGADPVFADFTRRDTRTNLESLCELLATDVSGVLAYDISYKLAERLGLTDHNTTQNNFFAWKQAAGF